MILDLKDIKKIGPVTLERLNANHIYTPKDLLLYFPRKYNYYQVDNSNAFCGEALCFKARVASRPIWIKTHKNSRAFVFYIFVNERKIKCVIYSSDYLRFKLQIGLDIICFGKYKEKENEFSLSTVFFEDFSSRIELDYGILDIKNKMLQNAVKNVLDSGFSLEDDLPIQFIEKYRLGSLNEIVKLAHFPRNVQDCERVRRRVRYEDFFWYTLSLEALKKLRNEDIKQPKIINESLIEDTISSLPFELTIDQRNVIQDCMRDLKSNKTMNRLIQGDVGSGKTIVAFITALAAINAGYQVAIMVPTEILAKQHLLTIKRLFPFLASELLVSSLKQKEKEDILFRLLHGRVSILIGTHALLENKVIFKNLGLVVIDEQHRFGVRQRQTLLKKLKGVDALYLTATPIPRTLGLTSFGDLDLSLIHTMPKNRRPVETKVISMEDISTLALTLRRHLACDEQIYVVVPLIKESESLDFIDMNKAMEIFEQLLPEAKLGVLHGKMKANEKDEIMSSFKSGKIECLLSTTVIEVGVDVSNATVMVILDAERYGLSQIHQLRGRVGRGEIQSYCYLVTTKAYVQRLDILSKIQDGFTLAEEDFKLRGPGDYLGEEQSGFMSLNFDYESNDAIIWKCALEDSRAYLEKYGKDFHKNQRVEDIFNQISYKKNKIN